MKKGGILDRLDKFQIHHRMLFFIFVIIATIFVLRVAVNIYNPDLSLLNFELHHFDFGVLILLVMNMCLLFGARTRAVYLLLSGVGFGLVLDDLWFIRTNILDPGLSESSVYNSTFPSVVLLVLMVIAALFLINHFANEKAK